MVRMHLDEHALPELAPARQLGRDREQPGPQPLHLCRVRRLVAKLKEQPRRLHLRRERGLLQRARRPHARAGNCKEKAERKKQPG